VAAPDLTFGHPATWQPYARVCEPAVRAGGADVAC